MVGRGERERFSLADLFFNFSRRIAARMSNVNDDQIVASNAVIDEVWIVSRRKHPNTEDVRPSTQARIFRQQAARGAYLSRDGGCRARAVLRNI